MRLVSATLVATIGSVVARSGSSASGAADARGFEVAPQHGHACSRSRRRRPSARRRRCVAAAASRRCRRRRSPRRARAMTTSPSRIDAVPMPPFMPPMPRPTNILPTVAPAPAPMLPSATAAAVRRLAGAIAPRRARRACGRRRVPGRRSRRRRRSACARWGPPVVADARSSRNRTDAGTRSQRHRAAAGQQDAVDTIERAHRLQHRRRAIRQAPSRRSRHPPWPACRTGCTVQPVGRRGSVKWPTRRPPTSMIDPAGGGASRCPAMPSSGIATAVVAAPTPRRNRRRERPDAGMGRDSTSRRSTAVDRSLPLQPVQR